MRSLLVSPVHSVFGSPTPIFINKLGIQSLAVVTPTSKEIVKTLCLGLFTQPDLGPAMPVKERSTGLLASPLIVI